jgi:hypothetical protein
MINLILSRISKFGTIMSDLFSSAFGCFAFTRGFQLVTNDDEQSRAGSPVHGDGRSQKSLADFGPAIFLLVFITSEAMATVIALRR